MNLRERNEMNCGMLCTRLCQPLWWRSQRSEQPAHSVAVGAKSSHVNKNIQAGSEAVETHKNV